MVSYHVARQSVEARLFSSAGCKQCHAATPATRSAPLPEATCAKCHARLPSVQTCPFCARLTCSRARLRSPSGLFSEAMWTKCHACHAKCVREDVLLLRVYRWPGKQKPQRQRQQQRQQQRPRRQQPQHSYNNNPPGTARAPRKNRTDSEVQQGGRTASRTKQDHEGMRSKRRQTQNEANGCRKHTSACRCERYYLRPCPPPPPPPLPKKEG